MEIQNGKCNDLTLRVHAAYMMTTEALESSQWSLLGEGPG